MIQRFNIEFDKRPVVVIILAGATSLGTVGAAQWVTNGEMTQKLEEVCLRSGCDLREDTEMEVLLKVTADVRDPARPWRPISRDPLKFFLADSGNLVGPVTPTRITLLTRNGVDDVVMLDGDEVRLQGKDRSALVAVCKAVCRQQNRNQTGAMLDLTALENDAAFLFESGCTGVLANFLRDHLQGRGNPLGGAVEIAGGAVKFHCEIGCIEHRRVPAF